MSLFLCDIISNYKVTWQDLVSDINQTTEFNPYCFSDDYYSIFKQIILSLILGEKITLLDSDLSSEELFKLTGQCNFTGFCKSFPHAQKFQSKKELLSYITNPNSNWSITLYTSGTSGLPKKVTHSFESITRFIKISDRNINNLWGFAYNPAHMAGIQVLFQALLNGNTLIRLFGLSKEQIYNEIENNSITHISATPTFYRLMLPCDKTYLTVKRITSGGEKYDVKIINQLKSVFPNAKITNIYASTEVGTLLASDRETFVIKPDYEHLIKIKDGELLIHKRLMGNSDTKIGEWYPTGDLIEIIANSPITFRFVSRRNEMINVGGYKVNPNEVEEVMRNIPGIKDVRVYGKINSVLGNIICSEVVKSEIGLNETTIRIILKSTLQEYKIPRLIRFVNKISVTRTCKILRR